MPKWTVKGERLTDAEQRDGGWFGTWEPFTGEYTGADKGEARAKARADKAAGKKVADEGAERERLVWTVRIKSVEEVS